MFRKARSFGVVVIAVCTLGACQHGDVDDPVDMTLRMYTPPPIQSDPGGTIPITPGGGFEFACLDNQHRIEVSANNPDTAENRLEQAAEDYCSSISCPYARCTWGAINRRAPSGTDQRYHYSACVNDECSSTPDGGHHPGDDGDGGFGDAFTCDNDPTTCGTTEGPWCPECVPYFCQGHCGWTTFGQFIDPDGNPFGITCPDTCAQDLGPAYACGLTGHCVLDPNHLPAETDCRDVCSGQCGIYSCTEFGRSTTVLCGSCVDAEGHVGECAADGDPTLGYVAQCYYTFSDDPPLN